MSNENFAIPGLQMPSQDFHLSRTRTIPSGSFLALVEWSLQRRVPAIELYYAGMPDDIIYTIAANRVSTFAKGNKRQLGIWLPDDMAECDWVAETSVKGQQCSRTLFTIGKSSNWEVPVLGQVQEETYADVDGTAVDIVTDTIYKGSPWSRRLTITDLNGAAVDLSGYSAWSQIRTTPGGTLLAPLAVTFVAGLTGVLDAGLSAVMTNTLPAGWAWWDVLLQRPDQTYDRTTPVRVLVRTGVTENG